ncbi:MAG TPA: hypothetical protein VNO55_03300 [Polyangia bacterium]|nr:hypothetical protein [Polyangia bacterium]
MIFRRPIPLATFGLLVVGASIGCTGTGTFGGNPSGSSGGAGGMTTGGPGSGGAPVSGTGGDGSGSGGAISIGTGGAAGGAGGMTNGGTGGAGVTTDAGGDDAGIGLPPLTPCTAPAVSRLKVWEMDVSGGTATPSGSPLRKVGDVYEMHVAWKLSGGGYGTANTALNNLGQYSGGADPAKEAVDLSGAPGVVLEYSVTGPAYMQIRTGTVPHGGDHFKANLPMTGDQLTIATLKFADFRRPGGTAPPGPDILKDVFSFTFVGSGTTTLTLRQVRVAGFTPPCN